MLSKILLMEDINNCFHGTFMYGKQGEILGQYGFQVRKSG